MARWAKTRAAIEPNGPQLFVALRDFERHGECYLRGEVLPSRALRWHDLRPRQRRSEIGYAGHEVEATSLGARIAALLAQTAPQLPVGGIGKARLMRAARARAGRAAREPRPRYNDKGKQVAA